MGDEVDVFTLNSAVIEPNDCPLSSPLSLSLSLTPHRKISSGRFFMDYIVDYASKRQAIRLWTQENLRDYEPFARFALEIAAQVDVSAAKKKDLLNVGILCVGLEEAGKVVFQCNFVTMVKEDKDGLTRSIISPLE
jgi:hypothetical protein